MLNLTGQYDRRPVHCDGHSRRHFLKVGGMAAGGLSLSQLLNLDARAGAGRSHKGVINIYLPGGPSHMDMWDLKPDAPSEFRGDFQPIKTNVPGMEICELFPKLAKLADKFTIIRSLVDSDGGHDCYQCMTGHKRGAAKPRGGWPSMGAWVSRVQGAEPGVPAHLSLMYPTGNRTWGEPGDAGFIERAHGPMSLVAKDPNAKAQNMSLQGISLDRLHDRDRLRRSIDAFKREADITGNMNGIDKFNQQAIDILTSKGLVDAIDVTKEDPKIADRYGVNDPTFQRDGAPKMIRNFLIARRLIEAGARVVSLNYSRWDWHGGDGMNFPRSRQEFPLLDQGLSALITDLHERGLDKDISVVVWGEFGRTPKINKNNSRDHWPRANACLLFGGGMRNGQVIGATDKHGGEPVDRPVKFQEVFATLYHNLGIDLSSTSVRDSSGRPYYLVDPGIEPIRELIG